MINDKYQTLNKGIEKSPYSNTIQASRKEIISKNRIQKANKGVKYKIVRVGVIMSRGVTVLTR